jgi:RHS repeat-associated protein
VKTRIYVEGTGLDQHFAELDTSTNTWSYFHQDRTNSVYLVTDGAGATREAYQYTAYGLMTVLKPDGYKVASSQIGNRFGFQGQLYDPMTGLVDMRARLYRPAWGRFVTADPIGLGGGTNFYAFVGSAPLGFWDPFGLDRLTYLPKSCPGGGCHTTKRADPFILHSPLLPGDLTGPRKPDIPEAVWGWRVCENCPARDHYDNWDAAWSAAQGRTEIAEIKEAQCAALYCHLVLATGHEPGNDEFSLTQLTANMYEVNAWQQGIFSTALGLFGGPLGGQGMLARGAMADAVVPTRTLSQGTIDRMTRAVANRMDELGIIDDNIGIFEQPAFNPHMFERGGNVAFRGMEVDAGVFEPWAGWPEWNAASLGTRTEAVIAHEYLEMIGLSHEEALMVGPLVDLPVSANARALLASQRMRAGLVHLPRE